VYKQRLGLTDIAEKELQVALSRIRMTGAKWFAYGVGATVYMVYKHTLRTKEIYKKVK
jgi:hypothetical protein